MTEHELSQPLTEAEQQRWAAYEERMVEHNKLKRVEEKLLEQLEDEDREATSSEQEKLSELRLKRYPLIPDIWEITDFRKLEARHEWRNELIAYRQKAGASAFAELTGHLGPQLKNWLGEFNLPTMVETYERAKANCDTVEAEAILARRKLNYANKNLSQLEDDDSELFHRLDPDKELGESRRTILSEILVKLFTEFAQHVKQDLGHPLTSSVIEKAPAASITLIPNDYHIKLAGKFFRNLTDEDFRLLAVNVGFIDTQGKLKGRGKQAMIWGMVETLVYHRFTDSGQTGQLVQEIARLLKIKTADDYTPDALNDARRKARSAANDWLLDSEKINDTAHLEFKKKQYEPRLTSPKKI
jgi:hypothetical protein